MEFFTNLIGGIAGEAVTALTGGSVFGLIGALVGNWQKGRQEKAQWERNEITAKRVAKEELALLKLQSIARQEETEAELALIEQRGSFEGLSASIHAESAIQDVHMWVNDIKALFRPALTLVLITVVTWVAFMLMDQSPALVATVGPDGVNDLLSYIITSLTFAASTAVVWWFGDRAMKPPKI